jgi:hypothetical protein
LNCGMKFLCMTAFWHFDFLAILGDLALT